MTLLRRIARPLIAAMFIDGGLNALRNPGARAELAKPVVDRISGPLHLPNDADLLVKVNAAAQLGAGTLFALGRFPRLSSAVLAGSIVPTTAAGHRFWEEKDKSARAQQRVHFLKNAGLLGGLLLATVDTEGKPGVAWRSKRAARDARRAGKLATKEASRLAHTAKREARREAKLASARIH